MYCTPEHAAKAAPFPRARDMPILILRQSASVVLAVLGAPASRSRAAAALLAMLAGLSGIAPPALAAEFAYLGPNNVDIDIQRPDPAIACNFSLAGTIEKGDAAKFAAVHAAAHPGERDFTERDLLCLDSPGGSFPEGLAIVSMLKEKQIGTKIEAGKRCESACSLVFMAGNFNAHESGIYHWRVMHPTAKLGFHAPSLVVEDGVYDQNSVTKSYNLAMATISRAIVQLVQGGESNAGNYLKVSLLGEMLQTPSTDMLHISTIDQAGRWDVLVGPVATQVPLTDLAVKQACTNALQWRSDRTAIGGWFGSLADLPISVAERTQDDVTKEVITNEMDGDGCKFAIPNNARDAADIEYLSFIGGGVASLTPMYFLDPSMPLAALATSGGGISVDPAPPAAPVAASPAASMPGASGECTVRDGATFVDREPCRREERVQNRRRIVDYHWPSGAKTVLEERARGWFVNGNPTDVTRDETGRGECAFNIHTQKLFCYTPAG